MVYFQCSTVIEAHTSHMCSHPLTRSLYAMCFITDVNDLLQYGVKIFVITSFKDTCYIEILPSAERSKRGTFVIALKSLPLIFLLFLCAQSAGLCL